MRGRGSVAQRAAAEVASIEAEAVKAREEADRERGRAAQLTRERETVADDPAAFHKLAVEAGQARLEAERLTAVAAGLDAKADQARHAGAVAVYEEARRAAERGRQTQADASGKVARAFKDLVGLVVELEEARTIADALDDAARSLRPVDVDAATYMDEPDWPSSDDLAAIAKVATAGPRQPTRAEQARVSRVREEEARAAGRRVPGMVDAILYAGRRGPSLQSFDELQDRFLELSEEEQAAALREATASLGTVEAEIRAEFRHPNAMPAQQLAEATKIQRVRGEIEARIARLSELLVPVG